MIDQINYITNDQGEQVGVLLEIATYQKLITAIPTDTERLIGLSLEELHALADSKLAVADQTRLDDLLAQNAQQPLSEADALELDRLLAQVDQLNILKTRARYTLQQQAT